MVSPSGGKNGQLASEVQRSGSSLPLREPNDFNLFSHMLCPYICDKMASLRKMKCNSVDQEVWIRIGEYIPTGQTSQWRE